jgi:hypothetical protein
VEVSALTILFQFLSEDKNAEPAPTAHKRNEAKGVQAISNTMHSKNLTGNTVTTINLLSTGFP